MRSLFSFPLLLLIAFFPTRTVGEDLEQVCDGIEDFLNAVCVGINVPTGEVICRFQGLKSKCEAKMTSLNPCNALGVDEDLLIDTCDDLVKFLQAAEEFTSDLNLQSQGPSTLVKEVVEALIEISNPDQSGLESRKLQKLQEGGRLIVLPEIGIDEYFGLIASLVECYFGNCDSIGTQILDYFVGGDDAAFGVLLDGLERELKALFVDDIKGVIKQIEDSFEAGFENFKTQCDPERAFDETSAPILEFVDDVNATFQDMHEFFGSASSNIDDYINTYETFIETVKETAEILMGLYNNPIELALQIVQDVVGGDDPTKIFRSMTDLFGDNELQDAITGTKALIQEALGIRDQVNHLIGTFTTLDDRTAEEFETVAQECQDSLHALRRIVHDAKNDVIENSLLFKNLLDEIRVEVDFFTYRPILRYSTDGFCAGGEYGIQPCEWTAVVQLPNTFVPYIHITTGEQPEPACTATDNDAPEFLTTPTTPVDVQCAAAITPYRLQVPTISDGCDQDPALRVTVELTRMQPACANNFVESRTWIATDEADNSRSFVQTLKVKDTVPPTIGVLPLEKDAYECDNIPSSSFDIMDNCDLSPTISSTETKTDFQCPSNYTLREVVTASDDCGNSNTAVQTFRVVDSTPPVLSGVPADATKECDADLTPATVHASDNCDVSVPAVFSEAAVPGTCTFNYRLQRSWVARDNCDNEVSAQQVVSVQDTTSPVLRGVPGDIVVQCDAVPEFSRAVTTSDNCDASPQLLATETRADGRCPSDYTLTRRWEAIDVCGNSARKKQIITVEDTTPPVLSGVPEDETVECDSVPAPANVATTDNCDPSPSLVFDEQQVDGACPSNYTLTRTWTSEDECLNTVVERQVITVQDTTPPVLTGVPEDVTVECDSVPEPAVVDATDNCDPSPSLVFDEQRVDGACPSNYTLTRTWTSEDACTNTAVEQQVIEVQDTTPPVITCNVFDLRPSDTNMRSPVIFQPTAVDNCDESPVVSIDSYECLKSNGKKGNLRDDKACKIELNGDKASVFITGGVGSTLYLHVSSTDACTNVSRKTCTIEIVN